MNHPLIQPVTPDLRNISNSEVTAFLSCKRMYYFAFVLNLAPKETSKPLARGTVGHLAFQRYVEARLQGLSHKDSMKAGLAAFNEAIELGYSLDATMNAQMLWIRYMEFHEGWPEWDLIGTEQRHALPITDTLQFPIRYDLYIRERSTGKYFIVDFKFTYEFWTVDDHDINGQMPKYISVMQANGFRVDGGYLEEIRTRNLSAATASDPKKLWKRTPYRPTPARTRTMLKQHVSTALKIEFFRNLSTEQQLDEAIPVFNKHGACKYCSFKSLCNSMTEGKDDLTVDIREDYVSNTYAVAQQVMEDII